MTTNSKNISPWLWVPTLYFAEGIPYFAVNSISVTMFTKMGVSNGTMALFTSLLYLPWVIKPLWSPFVDIIRTKRWWVMAMQILMSVCFIALALSLPSNAGTLAAHRASDGSASISLFTVTLIIFWIMAFASATHDIAADGFYMLGLTPGEQSLFVGIRSTFYRLASVFGQGVLVVIAGFIFRDFGRTFVTFFKKPRVIPALAFLLLYRLPEAFLIKMMSPFLLAPAGDGGLGLTTTQVGAVYGTAGVVALTVGGILGGMAVARWGLKRCLWPMALSLALPCLAFVWLSVAQPSSISTVGVFVCLDQFGYGFGFTAYMLYMIYFSQGEFKTSHYSLCTAFMALSMMLPGMVAGYLQEALGYTGFFWAVGLCCLVTVFVTTFLKIEPEYGKK